MSKLVFGKKIKMYILVLLLLIAYFAIWVSKGIALSEGALSKEDELSLTDCYKMVDTLITQANIPAATIEPEKKAVFCSLEINFLLTKYRNLQIYGVTELKQQEIISDFLSKYQGPSKPIKLTIYRNENWITSITGSQTRGKEEVILTEWFK